MSRTVYALLVGINDYLGGVNGLNGCVNDVKRMAIARLGAVADRRVKEW